MRWFPRGGALLVLGVLGVLLAVACGDATGDGAVVPEEDPAATVEGGMPEPSDEEFEELARRAEAAGEVRVIVGVQAGVTPEGDQDEAANAAQRAAIRRAQDRVAAALEGTDYSVERRFETVPQIVLILSPEAVEALWRSGLAASLQIDEAVPPV